MSPADTFADCAAKASASAGRTLDTPLDTPLGIGHHGLRQHRGLDVDILSALDAATDEFGRRLGLVGEDAWTFPTPCPDWDVHHLAAHVIGGNRFASYVLDGMPAMEAIEQVMSERQLGDDAVGAWTTTSVVQASAFRALGALERRIDHPLGEISGREFLEFRVFDITLHAWDLARSIGADEQLAPGLIDVVLDIVETGPPGMGFGIGPLGQVAPGASAQEKLLDLTGRGPTWPAPKCGSGGGSAGMGLDPGVIRPGSRDGERPEG